VLNDTNFRFPDERDDEHDTLPQMMNTITIIKTNSSPKIGSALFL
jgi:hypothetical protein